MKSSHKNRYFKTFVGVRVLFLIIPFFLTSDISAQFKWKSKNYLDSLVQARPAVAIVNIKLDDSLQLANTWMQCRQRYTNWVGQYRDSLGNFYIGAGEYAVNLAIDSIAMIWYKKIVEVSDGEQLQLNFPYEQIKSEIDTALLLIEQIVNNDTLIWTQQSDNSWVKYKDTLQIYWQGRELQVNWQVERLGAGKKDFFEKTFTIDSSNWQLFKTLEKRLSYPGGMRKYKFNSCDNCRGRQTMHHFRFRDYVKFYLEPSCSTRYWYDFRCKVFGKI